MKVLRCLFSGLIVLATWIGPLYAATDSALASNPSQRLWQQAARETAQLEQRGGLLHDATMTTFLQTVVDRLWLQTDSNLNPLVIETIIDPRLEAYAYPNGYCFVTTGMLVQMENEDQLAMVIAHEMVHYIRQHAIALYDHYQKSGSEIGLAHADRLWTLGEDDIAQTIEASEYQADQEGLSILTKAGYRGSQVLALMSALMKDLRDRAQPGAMRRLKKRMADMTAILRQVQSKNTGAAATDGGRETYLKHIAPALIANAQAAVRRGEWDQADRCVSMLQETAASDARVYFLKGEILRRRDRDEGQIRSIGYYEKALAIDPGFPSAQRALGEIYFKAGRLQKARPYFEAFLSLAPQDDACEYIKGYLRQCLQ